MGAQRGFCSCCWQLTADTNVEEWLARAKSSRLFIFFSHSEQGIDAVSANQK